MTTPPPATPPWFRIDAADAAVLEPFLVPTVAGRVIPLGPDRVPVPVVQVSAERPAVADLPRVHRGERNRYRAGWFIDGGAELPLFLLLVDMTIPVHAQFGLAFHLPADRLLLDAIRATGALLLVSQPLDLLAETCHLGDCVPLTVPTADLGAALDALDAAQAWAAAAYASSPTDPAPSLT
jgi:hypothetical protein